MCAHSKGEVARKLASLPQGQGTCEAAGDSVHISITGTVCLLLTPAKHIRSHFLQNWLQWERYSRARFYIIEVLGQKFPALGVPMSYLQPLVLKRRTVVISRERRFNQCG